MPPDRKQAGAAWAHVAGQVGRRWPKPAGLMDERAGAGPACMAFPVRLGPATRQAAGGDPDRRPGLGGEAQGGRRRDRPEPGRHRHLVGAIRSRGGPAAALLGDATEAARSWPPAAPELAAARRTPPERDRQGRSSRIDRGIDHPARSVAGATDGMSVGRPLASRRRRLEGPDHRAVDGPPERRRLRRPRFANAGPAARPGLPVKPLRSVSERARAPRPEQAGRRRRSTPRGMPQGVFRRRGPLGPRARSVRARPARNGPSPFVGGEPWASSSGRPACRTGPRASGSSGRTRGARGRSAFDRARPVMGRRRAQGRRREGVRPGVRPASSPRRPDA